jgi:hypothetical protein
MGKEFDASLVITSKSLSLIELATLLERQPQSGSHDKGAPHSRGNTWGITIWRENARDQGASLEAQCLQLLGDMPSKCADLLADKSNFSVKIDVAVYHDSVNCSVPIPANVIEALAARGIAIEIVTYPCREDTI